jgi:hypothetical protein
VQQIRNLVQNKEAPKWNASLSVIMSWCSVKYVKITLPEDIKGDISSICELLDEVANEGLLSE